MILNISDAFALISVFYKPFETFKEISQRTVDNFIYYAIPILVSGIIAYVHLTQYNSFFKQEILIQIGLVTIISCLHGSIFIHIETWLIRKFILLFEKINSVDYRNIRQVIVYSYIILLISPILSIIMFNTEGVINIIFMVINIFVFLWFLGLIGLGVSRAVQINKLNSIIYTFASLLFVGLLQYILINLFF